jgi:hypothetical protein
LLLYAYFIAEHNLSTPKNPQGTCQSFHAIQQELIVSLADSGESHYISDNFLPLPQREDFLPTHAACFTAPDVHGNQALRDKKPSLIPLFVFLCKANTLALLIGITLFYSKLF